jgi:hypothetical protein
VSISPNRARVDTIASVGVKDPPSQTVRVVPTIYDDTTVPRKFLSGETGGCHPTVTKFLRSQRDVSAEVDAKRGGID